MTLRIDDSAIRSIIEREKPKRIAFNAPDGLLPLTRNVMKDLEVLYPGLQSILIADATYGSCDTADDDAQRLGADIAFHLGHNVKIPKFGKISYTVDVWDDISFHDVAVAAAQIFSENGLHSVGLCTFAQHVKAIKEVAQVFKERGIKTVVGRGLGQLYDGQIFGCEFYPAYNIKDQVDAMALLGGSMFHALGLCLSTGRQTYMLDPYSNDVTNVQDVADERLKRAILSIYKARDVESFGVIVCLKEGQMMFAQSLEIKKKLESFGRQAQLIALREITSERLNSLSGVDAFIQTGCPRISIDGYNFSKPVLSVPQTEALFNLLAGKEIDGNILVRKHWL